MTKLIIHGELEDWVSAVIAAKTYATNGHEVTASGSAVVMLEDGKKFYVKANKSGSITIWAPLRT